MQAMENRRLRLVFTLVAAMAMLVPAAPAAHSVPAVLAGVPGAVCAVAGTAPSPSPPPITPIGSTGSFTFNALVLECAGPKGGSFSANVFSETTDPFHSTLGHSLLANGSTSFRKTGSNDVEYHTGKIDAVDSQGNRLLGKFHHVVLGAVAIADGYLWKGASESDLASWNDKKTTKIAQKFSTYVIAAPIVPPVPPNTVAVAGPLVIWDTPLAEVQVECGGQPNVYNNNKPVTVQQGLGLAACPATDQGDQPKDWPSQ